MKKIFVILLAVMIALCGGLLVFGVVQGPPQEFHQITHGLLAAPSQNIQEGADHWYMVSDMLSASTQQQKAANLLVYTAYNHIQAKEFYFEAHVDVRSGNKYTCSDYYRTNQGANTFYEAYAYTGSINTAIRRLDYVDQRVSVASSGVSYSRKEKVYSTTWLEPETSDRALGLPAESPYIIYSWYDLPLDMGGKENAFDAIDASLIGSQVTIESPTENVPFYTLIFSADIEKAKASSATLERLKEGTGNVMSKIDLVDLSDQVEIWPSGLFRSIQVNARVVATVSGKGRGEATIDRYYAFSYDVLDCSVARKFEINDLTQYLKAENQERIKAEYALLPAEEADE